MSPIKIRYIRTPSPEYDYDYHRRYMNYDYLDYKRPQHHKRDREYDKDSVYGETVYEYEPDYYSTRSYSPPPRRRHHNHHHHRHHHRPHHHHHQNHHHLQPIFIESYDHHVPHIHYLSPRSEPPLRYPAGHSQRLELTMLKSHPDPHSDPRVTVYDKRHKYPKQSHTHCGCHACPEKSSKAIPTMHYDELRCPHCAAHVQPAQDEVLAYPWTVQSYRPGRKARSLPPGQISVADSPVGPASGVTGAPPTVLTYRSPNRQRGSLAGKENQSLVAPTKPLFRANNDSPPHSQMRTINGSNARQRNGSYVSKTQRQGPMSVVRENGDNNDFDDIKPNDSISNVELPPLRAQSTELKRNDKARQSIRAQTEVDANYTREKYFRSMELTPPAQALPTPRPAKDTASNISRMLRGEYFDRHNGKTYSYNVNYGRRKVYSDRRPVR